MIEAEGRQLRLIPLPAEPVFVPVIARRRGYGSLAGAFEVTEVFFAPLPDDEQRLWDGQGKK